jgi:site-specific DNA recombinase
MNPIGKGDAMKVIGYIRVSTEEQATNGQSLDAQRAKLEAYAALYDLELVEIIADAGVSAKSLNRPGLQDALTKLRRGAADGLVIAKLDRLTRSVGDWQRLIDAYFGDKAGKQLFSVADSIDTRTAAGRLVLNVLLSVAQWERETIAERTTDALQYKIRKGERCGKVRFGYKLAADDKTLVADSAEQEAIALMKELRAAGQTLRDIAGELNRRGIQTKEGGQWKHTTVRGILARAA